MRSDIEEWRDGRRDFGTEEFLLKGEFLTTKELSERLGRSESYLRSKVYEERWDVVPRPTGKAARSIYWSRLAFERWDAARVKE